MGLRHREILKYLCQAVVGRSSQLDYVRCFIICENKFVADSPLENVDINNLLNANC